MTPADHIILYVDDERANRIVFEQSFGRRFRVKTVPSGQEALELMRTLPIGVLVTDQRMPDMSGNELLMRVKELYPDVIRIAITAFSELDPILRAVNDGLVARYIVKPWDHDELEQILTWGLEAFDIGRENSALQLRLIQTERLVTLGSIGAAVIHDINQPLAYLLSNSERLSQLAPSAAALGEIVGRYGGELPLDDRQRLTDLAEELPEIVNDMLEGCKLMQGLTASIRRLLKPATEGDPQVTEPLPVIRYAISMCREIATRARGNISYDGPTTLPKVCMGSVELSQTLINLIANAAQALGRRPTPGGRVIVSAADLNGRVRIAIVDDGPGMPAEVLQKVGTPFFSTRAEGTGLGVSQCRRLVERAAGEFTLTSVEGQGTTATVTLPVEK